MARSLKKGPFVDAHLMKKVETMGEKNLSDILSQYITVRNIYPYM